MWYNLHMRNVVFYFKSNTNACYDVNFQHGLVRFARTSGWRLLAIDAEPTAVIRRRIPQLVREYAPLGAITTFHEGVEESWPAALPSVWVDTFPSRTMLRASTVRADNVAIARMAANELLRDRTPRTFACFSLSGISWARERAQTFAQSLQAKGSDCLTREISVPGGNFTRCTQCVKNALRDLPRPLGVFAVNDRMANQVMIAAEMLGLRIPEELSLVGVDNDESLCLAGPTAITSIQPDWDRCGWLAGEALQDLLLGKPSGRRLNYGPIALIRRASTLAKARRKNDPRVERALAFIRENAASPISVNDVIAAMGCSRRLGELRFRESTGKSILAELHARRLDLVMAHLNRKQTSITALANLCGFRSASALRAFFQAQTGQSMRDWRRRQSVFFNCRTGRIKLH